MKLKKMKTKNEIWIYSDGRYEREKVVAEKWMRLIYDNPVGGATLPFLVKRKALSRLYGIYCRTKHSARKIPKFIRENQVDMTGCNGPYKNFAQFFSRERCDVRFPEEPGVLGSPCEGLASAYTGIDPENLIAAKGSHFSLSELLVDNEMAESYRGGTMLRIRLTPANYHRMHFFDDGEVAATKFLNGDLYSVSPLALNRIVRLYCRNKRALIMYKSQNFGDVALVEVGATFVGSIVHCFEDGESARRAQLASYFLPGGSLLLAFFKKGAFTPGSDLLSQSAAGYETRVSVGAPLN
ncbi:MAG: phosphatidylserine decarboxylase [Defluviitaleaceae bacterium]|nr:phosphatidylserine decarboxylase [Defluviitaleaceae bacterium]